MIGLALQFLLSYVGYVTNVHDDEDIKALRAFLYGLLHITGVCLMIVDKEGEGNDMTIAR